MKWQVTPLVCLVLMCSSARADSWALTPEVKDTEFTFGDTRIVLHYDSTRNNQYPEHATRIYLKNKLVGQHDNVGFQKVYASPDNVYFLGLSNRGLVNPAFVVFDRNGKIHKMQPHGPKKVHYFVVSKTLIRKWCNLDEPKPTFHVVDGKLEDVRICAFDGSRISLWVPENLYLRSFLLENLLKTHAKPKENCYVSFGTEPGGTKEELRPWDPPKRFLERFQRRAYQVKPASGYPKREGKEPFPPKNPETGIPDGVYTVEILAWLDENRARVRTGMSRDGFREARGESFLVEKRDRMWRRVNESGKQVRRTVRN
jgi:hypothetical protein